MTLTALDSTSSPTPDTAWDKPPAPTLASGTAAALAGVKIIYCTDTAQARQLLAAVTASGKVAIDIETARDPPAEARLAQLLRAKADTVDTLKALRQQSRSIPPHERAAHQAKIASLVAAGKAFKPQIERAEKAGLDPHQARIRLRPPAGRPEHTGPDILALLNGVSIVAHNVAFELSFLEKAGVKPGRIHCTMQAAGLAIGKRALSEVAAECLQLNLGKELQTSDWNANLLTQAQIEYAALDAVVVWRLAEKLRPSVKAQRSAYVIQMGAVPAVTRMARRGFRIDVDAHARLLADLGNDRHVAEQEYREACLVSGQAALTGQVPTKEVEEEALLTALLTKADLKRWPRTPKTGKLSFTRSDLIRIQAYHPPIAALVKILSIDKLLTSFGPTLAGMVSPVTGRIHAGYLVAGAASGRATCSGPNMQQVPRDPRFRGLFVPELGHLLVVADYSSMELRAFAHISGDRAMTEAFQRGAELHKLTAARMTGKKPEDVTDEERRGAKAVNFGAIYGQGARALVESAWKQFRLVLTLEQAEAWIRAFKDAYPGGVAWQRAHHLQCERQQYIVIGKDAARGVGRIFPLSRIEAGESSYTRACNYPIQGGCADAAMLAIKYIDERLSAAGIDGGLVAWSHDEFVASVYFEDVYLAAEIIKQGAIDGFSQTFPGAPLRGLVEPHIGLDWHSAKRGHLGELAPTR